MNESAITVNSEFKRFKRGQSFENERGCDEIMQQFMSGLESFIEPTPLSSELEEELQTKLVDCELGKQTLKYKISALR